MEKSLVMRIFDSVHEALNTIKNHGDEISELTNSGKIIDGEIYVELDKLLAIELKKRTNLTFLLNRILHLTELKN